MRGQEPNERLQKARKDRGFASGSDAAAAYHWNRTTYLQHENGTRDLSREAARRYAQAFRIAAGYLLYGEAAPSRTGGPKVRIVGKIGAGQEVCPVDDLAETTSLAFPDAAEAFEVEGDSMLPVARHRDIIIASAPRLVSELIGIECVVDLEDGRRFFKTIERGSSANLFTLLSYNAEPIRDVKIIAAGPILAIKRR